jgi:hypothetical protein
MMFVNTHLQAGGLAEHREVANFFRLLESEGALDVIFYAQGAEIARAENVKGGYSEVFKAGFDAVKIRSNDEQRIQFVIRNGSHVGYDVPPVGNVLITGKAGAIRTIAAMADGTGGEVLPAHAFRNYLLIQNQGDDSVFLTFDGSEPGQGAGIELLPMSSCEFAQFLPIGAVRAFADSLCALVCLEG